MTTQETVPVAQLDHPIVEIACRMLRPDGQGGWTFEQADAAILEAVLIQEKHDTRLDGAVLGLFEVASDLHEKRGSIEAAGALLAVLGRVGPRLQLRSSTAEALAGLRERALDRMAAFTGERPAARSTVPVADMSRSEGACTPADLIQSTKRKIR